MDLRLRGSSPHIVGCLAAGAQLINLSRPGEEPLRMEDVKEDTRLLLGDDALAGKCCCGAYKAISGGSQEPVGTACPILLRIIHHHSNQKTF